MINSERLKKGRNGSSMYSKKLMKILESKCSNKDWHSTFTKTSKLLMKHPICNLETSTNN